MKRLLVIVLVLAGLWAGYWVVGSRSAQAAFEGWFEDRRAEGWQADYSDLRVAGFPSRFDTTIEDVAIADPATGWSWQAPFVQIFALSYKPTEVIAVLPPSQTIATPLERLAVTSDDLRASLNLDPAAALPLDRARLVAEGLRIEGTESVALDTLRVATERTAGSESTYRYGISAENLSLPAGLLAAVADGGALPETVEMLELDMHITWDRPWDLDALNVARPQPQVIDLRLARAAWGALELSFDGEVEVDAQGRPTGVLSVRAARWRDMLRLAVASGALEEQLAETAERGLALVANLSGDPETLNVALDIRDGQVSLGPVHLGPAPILRLR